MRYLWVLGVLASVACVMACAGSAVAQEASPLRAPAVPLVTHNPYFSVWSFSDKLTDSWPRHWTGKTMGMCGLIRIDGKTYSWCGMPPGMPPMEQKSVEVGAFRSAYRFEAGGVRLDAEFISPLFVDWIGEHAPATRLIASASSVDGKAHAVSLYFDCSAEWCVNTPDQRVRWSRARNRNVDVLCFASQDQPVLQKRGDDLRIDWGTFMLVPEAGSLSVISGHTKCRHAFFETGQVAPFDDLRQPRSANDDFPVLAASKDLGQVSDSPQVWHLQLAYDDQYSIELFERKLRPIWPPRDQTFLDALIGQGVDESGLREMDRLLVAEFTRVGGPKYAALAALAYRQTMAAHKIVADWDGTPLMFSKENFSNGCIGTVDVIFPACPFFLYFNPELLKAQLRPLMQYAASARWKFPFAPHDLGTYPLANGQVYGGGERTEEDQMPVEETGNMLIMLAALAQRDGNADFAAAWWPTVEKWAAYLKEKGLDPENQLCTDDFAGHLAHNANLSIKAIIGLGAFAQLCDMQGKTDIAAEYRATAQRFAMEWVKLADDGDHYRLAFDKPGTWSQKYNLIWDRVLGTGLFPMEVSKKEMAYYRTKLNKYGLPLDNREKYAKLDFSVWTACLTGDRADFEALVNPLYDFANETPDRVPLTDWYGTVDGKCVGFRARSVVGAVYLPMLLDKMRQK